MLQIITGRFFKSEDRYVYTGRGILYSNYSWVAKIETAVGVLEPVSYNTAASAYVLSYTNQIEKDGVLVRTGDEEIVDQFAILASFGLKAYFSTNQTDTERSTQIKATTIGHQYHPAQFVSRIFDQQIRGTHGEAERFKAFIEKVMTLRRDTYEALMDCLSNIRNALQVLPYNLDLAYSMLVYSLEALSQTHDRYEPKWSDYEQSVKETLDELFDGVDAEVATQIRQILLKSAHLRLQGRFIEFCANLVDEDLFRAGNGPYYGQLRRAFLKRALKQAYATRSTYVHKLGGVLNQLKHPVIADHDMIVWEKEPHLTFRGLFRLCHHVIENFVWRQRSLPSEKYDWRSDLPFTMEFRLAPEYWVWKSEGLRASDGKEKLTGLLQLLESIRGTDKPIVSLSDLCEKIENLLPQASSKEKPPLLAVYHIYNGILLKEFQRKNWEKFVDAHQHLLKAAPLENMLVQLSLTYEVPLGSQEAISAYKDFQDKRFAKSTIELPFFSEMALVAAIANRALTEGDLEGFRAVIDDALWDLHSVPDLRKHFLECRKASNPLKVQWILSCLRSRNPSQEPVEYQI